MINQKGFNMRYSSIDTSKYDIRVFMLSNGWVIIGKMGGEYYDDLIHPFRLIPDGKGGVTIHAVFMRDEYLTIRDWTTILFELPVDDSYLDIYIKYENILWSDVLTPPEKKIIL
jgi:hypothetical protein